MSSTISQRQPATLAPLLPRRRPGSGKPAQQQYRPSPRPVADRAAQARGQPCRRQLDRQPRIPLGSTQVDGVAVSLIYRQGQLAQLISRGDGLRPGLGPPRRASCQPFPNNCPASWTWYYRASCIGACLLIFSTRPAAWVRAQQSRRTAGPTNANNGGKRWHRPVCLGLARRPETTSANACNSSAHWALPTV